MSKLTVSEMMERMGSETTEYEAKAMLDILSRRGLDIDDLSDSEFFALIPEAIRDTELNEDRRRRKNGDKPQGETNGPSI